MRTENQGATYEEVLAHLRAGGTARATFDTPEFNIRKMTADGLIDYGGGVVHDVGLLGRCPGDYELLPLPTEVVKDLEAEVDRLLLRVKVLEARLAKITAIANGEAS
jgi:hypothetical protein